MLTQKTAALLRPCAFAALFFLCATVVIVMTEIILRNVWGKSLLVVEEFVGYGLAAMTFLALADTLLHGTFIRVSFVISNLNERGRRICEVFTVVVTILMMVYLTYYFVPGMIRNFTRNVTSTTMAEVPQWIPQAIVAVGMAAFFLQLVAYLIDLCRGGPIIESEGISE